MKHVINDRSRTSCSTHETRITVTPAAQSYIRWVFDQCGGARGILRLAEIGRNLRRHKRRDDIPRSETR